MTDLPDYFARWVRGFPTVFRSSEHGEAGYEPVARDSGRIVAVRADDPGGATVVRPMAVESGRSVLRAANPNRPSMEVTRVNETMMRAVVAFVGRAV